MRAARKVILKRVTALGAAMLVGMLSACAAPSSYMGIKFAPVEATAGGQSEMQSLARRAQSGDKQAQLELGIRFEEGRGDLVDLEKAKELYTLAAKDTQIKHTSYIPENGIVRAETTYAGVRKGLLEAKKRLGILDAGRFESGQSNSGKNSQDVIRINSAGRPGIHAILFMVKVEFFSDDCFYISPKNASISVSGEKPNQSPFVIGRPTTKFIVNEAYSCFANRKLPEDCRLFRPELLKVLAFLIEVRRRDSVAKSLSVFKKCLSVGAGYDSAQRAKNATPMDFELYGTEYSDARLRKQIERISGRIPYTNGTSIVAHIFWQQSCRRSVASRNLTMLDLIICDHRTVSDDRLEKFRQMAK